MPDTYLRSSRILIGRHDYFTEEEPTTVKVNGIEMSIDEFRAMRPGSGSTRDLDYIRINQNDLPMR